MRDLLPLFLALALASCGGDIKKDANNGDSSGNNGSTNGRTGSNNRTTTPNAETNNRTTPPPNNTVNNRDWSTCYRDDDGDGYGGMERMIDAPCDQIPDLVWDGGDCDDSDEAIHPDAVELCDSVDRDCDGTSSGPVPDVCPTIQDAIDVATAGSVVEVAAGTYRENLVFGGAAVRVVGAGPGASTIDGSDGDSATVVFANGEGSDAGLEGFTITGGAGFPDTDGRQGGGIYVDEADPTLRDLVVSGNRAGGDSGYGGGIHLSRSAALLEGIDVFDNSAGYYGGGIHLSQSDATLRQVRVIGNQSLYGGGVAIYFSDATLANIIVADNDGTFGGGVLLQGDSTSLSFAQIVGNNADEGGGVLITSAATPTIVNTNISGNSADVGGAIDNEEGTPSVTYSNFFDNGESPLSDLSLDGATGVLRTDPAFVSSDGDAKGWDLHLRATSPLVDAGEPATTDADGSPADIGAYGGPGGDW